MELGHGDTALALFRRATALSRRPQNLAALATALILTRDEAAPDLQERLHEAALLVDEALKRDPQFEDSYRAQCLLALARKDVLLLDSCSARLVELTPDDAGAHYMRAMAHGSFGRLDAASEALERAHALGLRQDEYERLRDTIARARPRLPRLARMAGILMLAWACGLLVLLLAAETLSRMVLRVVEGLSTDASTGPAWLRRSYAAVLGFCCVYYYLSIPIVTAAVLFAGGAAVYVLLSLELVPLKLLAIAVALTAITVWAIVKSLLTRARDVDPGRILDLHANPRLAAVLGDVASRVGTRPVDSVFVTPGTEIAVFERGGLLRQLRDRSQRCLLVGVGALADMDVPAFEAVLAHEYGHFVNRDTAGGRLALAVRRSMLHLGSGLAKGGAARWYNPAWLFVTGFYRLFLRVSQGASRLQELLADRWAARLYGPEAFARGLRHVVEREVRFRVSADAVLKAAVQFRRPVVNLYEEAAALGASGDDVEAKIRSAMDRQTSPYDSHPAPADRLRLVGTLATDGDRRPRNGPDEVWHLFTERDALEREMTEQVRRNIRASFGVDLASSQPMAGTDASP